MREHQAQYMFLHQSTLELLTNKGNSQSIWFVNYSALEKMDSLDAMEGEAADQHHTHTDWWWLYWLLSLLSWPPGDVELEWEETTM